MELLELLILKILKIYFFILLVKFHFLKKIIIYLNFKIVYLLKHKEYESLDPNDRDNFFITGVICIKTTK